MFIHCGADAGTMRATIETCVHPTEDPDRVVRAVLNIFPDAVRESAEPAGHAERLVFLATDMSGLAERLANQRILDTARAIFLRSLRTGAVSFRLNKQAAFAGRVNFTDPGSPLGDLAVTLETDDPEGAIDAIAGGRR